MDGGIMKGSGNAAQSSQGLPPSPASAPAAPEPGRMKLGMVQVSTAEAAAKQAAEEKAERMGTKVKNAPARSALASLVIDAFDEAVQYRRREGLDTALVEAAYRRKGRYSPSRASRFASQGEPLVCSPLTMEKCDFALSLLSDVFLPDGEQDRPWGLEPSPDLDLAPEASGKVRRMATAFAAARTGGQPDSGLVSRLSGLIRSFVDRKAKEKAAQAATNLEDLVWEQLQRGGFDREFSLFLDDLVTFPSAILKGPVVEEVQVPKWTKTKDGARMEVGSEKTPVVRRVDPFDFYPSPLATSSGGPGPLLERVWLPRHGLEDMVGLDGYDDAAIRRVLSSPSPPPPDMQGARDKLEVSDMGETTDVSDDLSGVVPGIEFHGFVPGRVLRRHNILKTPSGEPVKDTGEYYCKALVVDNQLIHASISPDPLQRPAYAIVSYRSVANSVWGRGIPQLLEPLQDVCDGSMRALVRNMGLASGVQAVVPDIDRVPPGEDITEVSPLKVWQFTNQKQSSADPVKFVPVPSLARDLTEVYTLYSSQADSICGLPNYGAETARSAGRTSSGLGILLSGSSKGLKRTVRRVHDFAVGPLVRAIADWDLRYVDDPSIRGDAEVVPSGAVSRAMREHMLQRRIEFLNITNNPVDLRLVGSGNRARILRQVAEALELEGPVTLTDPEIEEIVRQDAQDRQAQSQAQQAEAQAKQAAAQAKAQSDQANAQSKQLGAQTDAQQAQAEAALSVRELQIREQKTQQDYEIAMEKLRLERERLGLEDEHRSRDRGARVATDSAKLDMEAAKAAHEQQLAANQAAASGGQGEPNG